MTREISIVEESWPLKKPFIISRSSRTETSTLKLVINDGEHQGLGEGVANLRYEETNASLIEQIKEMEKEIADGMDRVQLKSAMPAGAARNAVDCALWDLEAKTTGQDVGFLSRLGWPKNIQTVQTISILSPEEMGKEALALSDFPIIKVKLNAEMVLERIQAVQTHAPNAQLLVDANESWTIDLLKEVAPELAELNVLMIEQPLPAGEDDPLNGYDNPLPLFADESCHTSSDLPSLNGKYAGVNIKLDKTGGLTEAIDLLKTAKSQNFDIMVGCMLGTSLGIAPTMLLAPHAQFVDIDAPALLAEDRDHGLNIDNGQVSDLDGKLWGGAT